MDQAPSPQIIVFTKWRCHENLFRPSAVVLFVATCVGLQPCNHSSQKYARQYEKKNKKSIHLYPSISREAAAGVQVGRVYHSLRPIHGMNETAHHRDTVTLQSRIILEQMACLVILIIVFCYVPDIPYIFCRLL